jgi:hypothetical protein
VQYPRACERVFCESSYIYWYAISGTIWYQMSEKHNYVDFTSYPTSYTISDPMLGAICAGICTNMQCLVVFLSSKMDNGVQDHAKESFFANIAFQPLFFE